MVDPHETGSQRGRFAEYEVQRVLSEDFDQPFRTNVTFYWGNENYHHQFDMASQDRLIVAEVKNRPDSIASTRDDIENLNNLTNVDRKMLFLTNPVGYARFRDDKE